MDRLGELLAPLISDPDHAGVMSDFDGTLSPIVDDPAAARPVDGAVELLADIARKYCTTAVISGRPVTFLRSVLPPTLQLAGVYGMEWLRDGEVVDHPEVVPWRPVVARAAAAAEEELPDEVLVEPKGTSVALHWRTCPHHGPIVERWAAQRTAVDGLVVHGGKMSLELRPPLRVDKGTTVRLLASGLRAVCFLGDDLGDLAAFDVLGDLRVAGVATAAIAVRSPEVPEELVNAADAVVDGPEGAVDVLRRLA